MTFFILLLLILTPYNFATAYTSSTVNNGSDSTSAQKTAQNLEDMTITDVVVVIAMEAEAKPFIEHLQLVQQEDFFPKETPFLAYAGKYDGSADETLDASGKSLQVTVITLGKDTVYKTGVDNVGTVPAGLATFLALQKLNSDDDKKILLVNAGTCGGFRRMGAKIGSVFVVTDVVNHDRRIPIPPFVPYGIGKISSGINTEALAKTYDFQQGVCTTGNSLDKTDRDDEIMKENNAAVKDMEAAAIAWSCSLFDGENNKIPYVGLKVVTDIVDGDVPTQEEFLQNLQTASETLQRALPKVLQHILTKSNSDSKDEL